MKTHRHLRKVFAFSIFLAILSACNQEPNQAPDPLVFQQPDSTFAIHTWWHWMDNAITREGITADLEAMKREGISTATILNISLFNERDLGVDPVIFNTPEWYEMFRWALDEANRLGITIGVHNCDGWSTSGGPWISPEQSMKQVTWSRQVVAGGQEISIQLRVPEMKRDFYRDIAVIACPAGNKMPAGSLSAPEYNMNGEILTNKLCDGNPFSMVSIQGPTTIEISYAEPIAVSQLAVHPRKSFVWGSMRDIRFRILVEAATGKGYEKIALIESPGINETFLVDCPQTTSRKFRLTINSNDGNERYSSFGLAEFEVLAKGERPAYSTEIPFHLEKIATTKAEIVRDIFETGKHATGKIDPSEIIDLTSEVNKDGILTWDAPAGNWEILRMGYTTTGSENGPSTNAGRGLECDKMDTTALNHHFSQFAEKLVSTAGDLTGSTFEYIFVDSWECGYQNWTKNFPEEFEERRGYSILPWLPVIAGEVVGGQVETERFLQDFRQTISDLIRENYYKHFNTLCHRLGVDSHAEVIYGGTGYPPLDVLRTNKYVDVPMFEFWAGFEPETKMINYDPVQRALSDLPMQAANLYGQKVVPAEAYTGYANYSESPWDLKLYGDRAFCTGVNEMVLHSYVHQPDDRRPGFTLGGWGQTFNRHNPWWQFASQWFSYHARVQYMLQQGTTSADLLCYTGDRLYDQWSREWEEQLPDGYSIQKCNADILMNHAKVKNSKIELDNGISYHSLMLPDDRGMELATLQQIAVLVEAGATVAGPKPSYSISGPGDDEKDVTLKKLADEMWGTDNGSGKSLNYYGKGKVYGGYSVDEIIEDVALQPDFTSDEQSEHPLLWIHKKIGDYDLWFVANQEEREVTRRCHFRVTGSIPQIWDPSSGNIFNTDQAEISGEVTSLSVTFPPKGSLFFMFGMNDDPSLPVFGESIESFTVTDFSGTISFTGLPDKTPVPITEFAPFCDFNDQDIEYYSGEARYIIRFELPDSIMEKEQISLCLGKVADGYNVILNGEDLGEAVFPGYTFPVQGILRTGENILEVLIGNRFRNMIIQQRKEYGELKDLWTTSPMYQLPEPGMPLVEGGISGPLQVMWRD